MKVLDLTVNSFWKEELGVKGIVEDGADRYSVSLYIKGSQIRDYSCSCVRGVSSKGMCGHETFLWETWKAQAKQGSGKQVSTSQEVRAMIREYTNWEVERILREGEGEPIRLVPKLVIGKQNIILECKLGRGRLYVIKDFLAFAAAVEHGANGEYGKNLSFYHSLESFHGEDRKLVEFIVDLATSYREHWEQFQKSAYVTVSPLRELVLGRANRDRFFELIKGRELEVEDARGLRRTLLVTEQARLLPVLVEPSGMDGIRISLEPETSGFFGERHLYLIQGEQLTCASRDASEVLRVFFRQMMNGWGSKKTVEIQKKDIPLFLERVLRRIRPYCDLTVEGVNLEEYRPLELNATFSFDSQRPGELTMKPQLFYGDYSFHPVEDDQVPRTICRDVPGEFRISQLITRYFKFREGQTKDLVIRDDDDGLFRLLKFGIPEFMQLGEVYLSEAAGKMRLLAPPQVSVGVTVSGSWLQLDVDAGEITSGELVRILSQYQQKKSYYRMKSGEFLQLDDQGLVMVARLVDGLSISRTQLQENKIRIPVYHSLYLDALLKGQTSIRLYRDRLYKTIIRGMKSVEDSDFEVPKTLNTILRGYQKIGFRWLRTLDRYGFGGILADDMGLGKTLQVIALLLDEKQKGGDRLPVSLIVCPASLVYNWENEIQKFAPELTVQTIAGTAAQRQNQLEVWEPYDVRITSYDLLKRDMELYQGKVFRFQILDEAQYMKNPGTQCAKSVKLVEAQTRFALTGTPIENRLSELWSIFDYLMPGFLLTYPKFKRAYETPIVKEQNQDALDDLRMLTGPFLLRRTKKEVLTELPEKLESVMYSQMKEEQRELYRAHAVALKQQLEQMGPADGKDNMAVLAELTRLRQLCCDPSLCYSGYKGGSAKLETCLELVSEAVEGEHKILLFSQFTSMLERIGKGLRKKGIGYYQLTGSTSKGERMRLVDGFGQDQSAPVFLISLKAGGTGLNLTAADLVIHYDPWWNLAAQNQATDRAHRIGQERQVQVWKLIAKDTIEENIMKLQESKQNLADQIVGKASQGFGSFGREELLRLLE